MALFGLSVSVILMSSACSVTSVQDDLALLPGAAIAQDEEAPPPAGVDRAVDVELSDFAITADDVGFRPGETVQFNVSNAGVVEHEFRLSNQDRVDDRLGGAPNTSDGTEGDGGSEDVVLLLRAGESRTMTFTFPDNADDLTLVVCLIPGHYEAGMSASLNSNP